MTTRSNETRGRRVGELAAATGLTVRTLHYYEEIGLLVATVEDDGLRQALRSLGRSLHGTTGRRR